MGSYVVLLRTPGAASLVVASLVGRLSVAMLDVPLILLAQRASGSFAGAGLAAAAFSAGIALTAPLRGRVVDRVGARRAVPPLAAVHGLALLGIAAAGHARVPEGVVVAAALAGASAPSLPAAMRLEWQRMVGRDDARLGQAYAFESVAQVSLFVVGPVLAGVGVAVVGAAVTMVVASALVLVGGVSFALMARVSGTPAADGAQGLSPIRLPGVQTLVAATVLADAALGVVAVAVVAFAVERDQAAVSGLLLAIFSIGSVLGGAVYGARRWSAPVERRLSTLMAIAAVALLPLALVDSIAALAVCLAIAGAPFTAQWATTSLALDGVTPPSSGAEAYNWLSVANAVGVTLGSLVAGVLVESDGPSAGFLAGAVVVALAAAVVAARRRTLAPVT